MLPELPIAPFMVPDRVSVASPQRDIDPEAVLAQLGDLREKSAKLLKTQPKGMTNAEGNDGVNRMGRRGRVATSGKVHLRPEVEARLQRLRVLRAETGAFLNQQPSLVLSN